MIFGVTTFVSFRDFVVRIQAVLKQVINQIIVTEPKTGLLEARWDLACLERFELLGMSRSRELHVIIFFSFESGFDHVTWAFSEIAFLCLFDPLSFQILNFTR